MSEYFHAKVKYLRQHSNGLVKQETAQYLIDAMSFTEAEARAMDEAGSGLREVQAVAISRSPIKEVVMYGDTDMWHKVKVTYSLMDEATEKEKKITTYLLVNSNDVKEAYERTEEHLKEMLVPFQIPKIEESPIIEVFEYQKQAPKGFVKVASTETTGQDRPDDGYNEARRLIISRTDAQKTTLYNFAHNPEDYTGDDEVAKATGLTLGQLFDCVEYITKEANGTLGEDNDEDGYNEEGDIYGGHEEEEECAMESDAVEAINPTSGQAVAFEIDPLWELLDSLGVTAVNSQIEEIKHMHGTLTEADFADWLRQEFQIGGTKAEKIWNFLLE